jgi:hypothetical protein
MNTTHIRGPLVAAAVLALAACGPAEDPTERLSAAAQACDSLGVGWDAQLPYLATTDNQPALDCLVDQLDPPADLPAALRLPGVTAKVVDGICWQGGDDPSTSGIGVALVVVDKLPANDPSPCGRLEN